MGLPLMASMHNTVQMLNKTHSQYTCYVLLFFLPSSSSLNNMCLHPVRNKKSPSFTSFTCSTFQKVCVLKHVALAISPL